MATDFTSTDNDPIVPDSDAQMFAPIPSWERGKKRRGMFGATRAAAEPRTFDAEPAATPIVATAAGAGVLASEARPYETRMDAVDPTDTDFAAAPVYATTPARRGNGAAPIAIAAGVILLGGLAAAGWYATQPHDQGIAQLTPGSTTTTTTAETAAPIAPPQMAQTAPTPRAVTHSTSTTTTRTLASAAPVRSHATVARARTSSRSAADVGSDASVRAPAPTQRAPAPTQAVPMPAPASPAPPAAAATPAPPLVLNLPPAPAPTQAAPPTTTAPAPTQTPPS